SDSSFLQHQYKYCVSLFAHEKDPAKFNDHVCGYTGMKKLTPVREGRLAEAQSVLNDLADNHPQVISSLPDRVTLSGQPGVPAYVHTETKEAVSLPMPGHSAGEISPGITKTLW